MRILKITCCDDCPHMIFNESRTHYVCTLALQEGEISKHALPTWCPLPTEGEYKFSLWDRVRHAADAGVWRVSGRGIVVARGMVENIENTQPVPMYTISFPDKRCWYLEHELEKAVEC